MHRREVQGIGIEQREPVLEEDGRLPILGRDFQFIHRGVVAPQNFGA
jgi:hypothetical protein